MVIKRVESRVKPERAGGSEFADCLGGALEQLLLSGFEIASAVLQVIEGPSHQPSCRILAERMLHSAS